MENFFLTVWRCETESLTFQMCCLSLWYRGCATFDSGEWHIVQTPLFLPFPAFRDCPCHGDPAGNEHRSRNRFDWVFCHSDASVWDVAQREVTQVSIRQPNNVT